MNDMGADQCDPCTCGMQAWKEEGRSAVPPDEAMRKHILVFMVLALLLVLGLGTAALAADDPIAMNMELSATRFSGPAEVTVTIRVTNTTDQDMPGPLALYYPTGDMIEEFGKPTLSAGQSKTWTGTWTVTEEQIAEGKVKFGLQYSILAADGSVAKKSLWYYVPIEDAGAVAQVDINRYITPSMARKGQKVSVIYEVVNTGTIDVTDVVIKESSAVSKTNGKIALVKAGEKETYTFTVTMGTKDLTSNASITYKANGKTYSDSVANGTIKYGDVKLTATLKADKKGGNVGDTVKLTLTLKNTGKADYQNVTVTDPSLGTVFTGLTVAAGKTITQEKEITVTQSTSYQFTVTGTTAAGDSVETATDRLAVTAVDPTKAVSLSVAVTADKTAIYILPDVVKFTVSVTNTSSVEATDVTVSASGVDLYTFDSIPAGETRTFVRDVRVEMAGNFRFDARVKNALDETSTFYSELIHIIHSQPTSAPTSVPIPVPVKPTLEEKPTDDGLPGYLSTTQNTLGIVQWFFLGVCAVALALIAVGAVSRVRNAAQSAKASDHLERDGYRDYTQAVSNKHRRMMPGQDDAEDEVDEADTTFSFQPSEPAPSSEADAAAVNDAMAELYPDAAEDAANAEEATYTRRRRTNGDE